MKYREKPGRSTALASDCGVVWDFHPRINRMYANAINRKFLRLLLVGLRVLGSHALLETTEQKIKIHVFSFPSRTEIKKMRVLTTV